MSVSYSLGDNPVVIVGAGFTLGVLDSPPLTTKNIIVKSFENRSFEKNNFPILHSLYKKVSNEFLTLNNIWSNIEYYSEKVSGEKNEIFENYKNSNKDVLVNYFKGRLTEHNFISSMLGIEIKRLISFHMTSQSMKGKKNELADYIEYLVIGSDINEIKWVSLNYDTCLEQLLEEKTTGWIYPFEHNSCKHIVIKPHGSLNMSFKTNWSISPLEHKLRYYNRKDKLESFNEREIGMSFVEGQLYENRPWLVGYIPDYFKHEHNTNAGESDIAHDLCRLNIGAFSMALQDASSLTILGYSMPIEDLWVWNKINMLVDRKIPVHISSRSSSERIKQQFLKYGYINVNIRNCGEIKG